MEATITADSTQEAEKLSRRARDALKASFANDCKVEGVKFGPVRLIKTLLIRRLPAREVE